MDDKVEATANAEVTFSAALRREDDGGLMSGTGIHKEISTARTV
jgi:hypothetical protein